MPTIGCRYHHHQQHDQHQLEHCDRRRRQPSGGWRPRAVKTAGDRRKIACVRGGGQRCGHRFQRDRRCGSGAPRSALASASWPLSAAQGSSSRARRMHDHTRSPDGRRLEFAFNCQPLRDLACAMRSAPRQLPLPSIAQPGKSKVRGELRTGYNFKATSIRPNPPLLGLADEKSDFDPVRLESRQAAVGRIRRCAAVGELHLFQRSSNWGRPIQALLRHRVVQPSCRLPCSRACASW